LEEEMKIPHSIAPIILKLGILSMTIALLVGCGGGSGSKIVPPPIMPTVTPSVYVIQNPATFGGTGTPEILQFRQTASGAVSPSATITGPAGANFIYLGADGSGNVYTATDTAAGGDVLEYAAGASGAAKAIRDIPYSSTLLTITEFSAIQGLSVNSAGAILISTDFGGVATFSPTANGNVAPEYFILGAFQPDGGLSNLSSANNGVWDSAGNVYVDNEFTNVDGGVVIFAPGATGNVAPSGVLNDGANGMAIDSSNNLYLTGGDAIGVFAPGSVGNAKPIRVISGNLTQIGIASGIALDSTGNIYVVSTTETGTNPTVLKFAAGASGNAAPVSSFTSTAWTNPDYGYSLAVH
jgi:hypothetical protein